MKVKIFQSGKIMNLMSDINEFLMTRPQIANVLQTQSQGLITITFFYREAAAQPQPGVARPATATQAAAAPPARPSTQDIELPE